MIMQTTTAMPTDVDRLGQGPHDPNSNLTYPAAQDSHSTPAYPSAHTGGVA